ncbi:MAG TPA: branched-chain amino acid ABC transporter ATP-binding protein/permease [Alphaproteobacteria bacterium]|jgi:branched-chain amino acid transport system permease protein|nr:branched-chain amino acid ABC transporter ATP-binding protein/permease [Alphaproteobacteria bacterium]
MTAHLARRKTMLAVAAFLVLVAAYPFVVPGNYPLGIGITAGAMAAGTVGFVLLFGYAQQLALGQAGFCMVGGYANAILCVRYHWDPFVALVAGAALAMLVAYVIATPILKLRGFVLAMASLAMHFILIVAALQVPLTGGALGTYGLPKFAIFGASLSNDLAYYYVVWLIVLLAVAIGLNIDRSRIGRALKAIAVSEMAAGSVGIDIAKYKVQMFVVSAGMASVSGSLTVHFLRAMDPEVFGFAYSLNIITSVIVGGLMSIWGGAMGAAIVTGLREALRGLSLPLWESVIMGALTVVVLIAFPRGPAGFLSGLFDRLTGERGPKRALGVQPVPAALKPLVDPPPAGTPILEVGGACRSFGSLRAVNDVSFTVEAGSITTLIGPNGAGKTTMFNLVGGYQPLDRGRVSFLGRPIAALMPQEIALLGIGRTFQNLQLFDNMTVLDNVMCGRHRLTASGILDISLRLPRVGREEAATRAAARDCLRFVGLEGAETMMTSALSFGHQRLVEIARALALEPKLLLMDEPASGLNDTETERLAELILRISALGVSVLLVEHDMRLVMGLADHVVVMHHGVKIADGPPDLVRADPEVIAAYLGQEVHERVA